MKRYLIIFISLLLFNFYAYADDIKDVEEFFNKYVSAANSYDSDYFSYYTDNARIIRVVENDNGTKKSICIPLERYKSEAERSKKLMRLRRYKNYYFNVKISPCGKDYKIAALRMPSTSDYKIPAYFIVGKDANGDWKIKEESMNTKVRTFLKES